MPLVFLCIFLLTVHPQLLESCFRKQVVLIESSNISVDRIILNVQVTTAYRGGMSVTMPGNVQVV